jgi:hypothetical protein
VTAADVRRPPAAGRGERHWPSGLRPAGPRLAWLYLASRRVPAALVTLAASAAVLRAALHWHWILTGGASAAQQFPLTIEAAAAAVIAVTTHGPFGDLERAAGGRLPWLRLGSVVALTAAAVGLLAAGAAAAHLPGGTLDLTRNVAGLTGVGLLTAALLGGALAWIGPAAYLVAAQAALSAGRTTPLAWPGRPPHDLGGALAAGLVFAAGAAVLTVRGDRDRAAGE